MAPRKDLTETLTVLFHSGVTDVKQLLSQTGMNGNNYGNLSKFKKSSTVKRKRGNWSLNKMGVRIVHLSRKLHEQLVVIEDIDGHLSSLLMSASTSIGTRSNADFGDEKPQKKMLKFSSSTMAWGHFHTGGSTLH